MNEPGKTGFGYSVNHFLWMALDWLYPPTCASCEQTGDRWCSNCQAEVKRIQSPICKICGDPVKSGTLCDSCKTHPPAFTSMRSWSEFVDPTRKALHSLKYRSNMGLGEILAKPLLEIIRAENWTLDAVIPIPLSKDHFRQRGYNQAALIARPVALELRVPYLPQSIKRIKETASQIHLTAAERYANLMDAFWANPATLKGKNVLLIDDVTTTGATMKSCADAVKQAGANQIYCLTVARALKKST